MRELLLFSGGLDSFIAWRYLNCPSCLYVKLGHRYQENELKAIDILRSKAGVITRVEENRLYLGDLEAVDANIPMRNSFLTHIAALFADYIWLVVQKGELDIPDRSIDFMDKCGKLLSNLNQKTIEVNSPFLSMTKTDMVKWYIDQGFPVWHLFLTTSCYMGENCGTCAACFRRWVSFKLNGLEEYYKVHPRDSNLAKIYYKRAKEEYYDPARCKEIILALEG